MGAIDRAAKRQSTKLKKMTSTPPSINRPQDRTQYDRGSKAICIQQSYKRLLMRVQFGDLPNDAE